MKYYIAVFGDFGDCIVGYDNEPTWNVDKAMFFDTEGEAVQWCNFSDEAKEWDKSDTFKIIEL